MDGYCREGTYPIRCLTGTWVSLPDEYNGVSEQATWWFGEIYIIVAVGRTFASCHGAKVYQ